jgi:hypothetical protein
MTHHRRKANDRETDALRRAAYRDGKFDIDAFNKAWFRLHGPVESPTLISDAVKKEQRRKRRKRTR